METYDLKEITLDVLTETLDDPGFHEWDHAGIALQAYLKCAERDLLSSGALKSPWKTTST
jgi:proline dehydrogenase